MGQLWLHYEEGLDYTLLNLMPYLIGMLPVGLSILSYTCQLPLKQVFQPQLMLFLIKFSIIFVQRVVGQMHKGIIEGFSMIVLFSCKSDNTISVQKNCHGAHNRGHQNIYPKVILVTIMQSWPLYIFLYNILILWPINLSRIQLFLLFLSRWIWVLLCSLNTLLNLEILIHMLFIPISLLI